MSTQRIKLTLALAAALLAGHSAAQEEEKKTPQAEASADLPDGFAVLERYVEAIGGVEANEKITGVQMVGRFNIHNQPYTGTVDISMAAPNKRLMLINVEGMGLINQGANGEAAWTTQIPGSPPTMLQGEDAKEQIEDANFYGRLKPREQYTSAETVGVFTQDDVKVYKVKLVDKRGNHTEALYEVESGLLRKQSNKESAEAVGFTTETTFNDYRDLKDGIKMPFELVVTSPQFSQTITFTEIKLDPTFPESTFDTPGAL